MQLLIRSCIFLIALSILQPAAAQINHTFTWMHGGDTRNQPGIYGHIGVPDEISTPGSRLRPYAWTGPDDELWLFGGIGRDAANINGSLNDLWRYNRTTGKWTWMGGSEFRNPEGVYGSRGFASVSNVPGGRWGGAYWVDNDGNFWLFGGNGFDSEGLSGRMNDLWRYNPDTGAWTWVSGSNERNQAGTYGTQGTPHVNNTPGGRENFISWTDSDGNFWLFGGTGYGSESVGTGRLNDLWRFSPETGQWTWVSGSNEIGPPGNWGTRGTPHANNVPGPRAMGISWTDNESRLWMFGGNGPDSEGNSGRLNDLWKFNPATGLWTWMGGSNLRNQPGEYGTQGIADAGNIPGARDFSMSWTGPEGRLWLLGGWGYNEAGSVVRLNDLWQYDPAAGEWTWTDGSETGNDTSVFGTRNKPDSANYPGAGNSAVAWSTPDGNTWMFFGLSIDIDGVAGTLNTLWRMDSSPASLATGAAGSGLTIPQEESGTFDFENDFTVEFWFKPTGSASYQALFSTQSGGASGAFEIALRDDGSVQVAGIPDDHLRSEAGLVTENEWNHLAYVRSASASTQTLFVNGAVAGLASDNPQTITNNSDDLLFGNGQNLQFPFEGLMNELRIWERALSGGEILDGLHVSPHGKEDGLAGAWYTRRPGMHGAVNLTQTGHHAIRRGDVAFSGDKPAVGTFIHGTEGWRMLGRPDGFITYQDWLGRLWTQGFDGASTTQGTPNVYFWKEETREWTPPSSITDVVGTAGSSVTDGPAGVIVYVYDEDAFGSPASWPKRLTAGEYTLKGDRHFDLSFTDTGISGDDGWNLVHNPYPVAVNWQSVVDYGDNKGMLNAVYIWDHTANLGQGGYRAHYGTPVPPALPDYDRFNGVIPAFQGFWVKAESQQARLRLSPDHHVQNRRLYRQPATETDQRNVLALRLSGEGFTDHASVVFDDGIHVPVALPALRSLNGTTAELALHHDGSRWNVITVDPAGKNADSAGEVSQQSVGGQPGHTGASRVSGNGDGYESLLEFHYDLHVTHPGHYTLDWPGLENFGPGWRFAITDHATNETWDMIPGIQHEFEMVAGQAEQHPGFSIQVISGESVRADEIPEQLPDQVHLAQNYPNPFNPSTVIEYDLPSDMEVRLAVYDMLGRRVAVLVDEQIRAGRHSVIFDASNLTSGVYLYRLITGGEVFTRKLTLIK